MGLFGGGSHVTTSAQRVSSFQVNQASYGSPIKLIFGTAMISGVLCDYQDFVAIAHETTTSSGGKGGGEVTQTDVSYTYTVAGIVALGEGVCGGVGQVWADSKTTDLFALNLTFFDGAKAQAPWGYMLSKHPDHALSYSGTSYVAGVVDLGSSASLPNMNFEVYGLCQDQAPPQYFHAETSGTTYARGTKLGYYTYSISLTMENGFVGVSAVNVSIDAEQYRQAKHNESVSGNVCTVAGSFSVFVENEEIAPPPIRVSVTVNYAKSYTPTIAKPTNQKMQQFSYQKVIEISNFQSNRYVEEYVFDALSGTGSWVTLDDRYYEIEQSQDPYEHDKPGVYTYTFNFDDRDDGYDRADPTYIRIYYTAIQASVDYTPTDANPRDIIWTLLTSTVYGENFPAVLIDEESLAVYSNYCKNNQLLISPVYADQTSCSDIIGSLMECTNSEYVFSQGKVKIVPYWDGLPANYAINDSNIINQDNETLVIERTSQADTYNIIPLEHTSRADQYNSNVVYATDEGDIELHGVRQAGTYSHPEIMNQSLAQAVAQLILQKQLYNRNHYKLKLGQEFILLEPMDACTLESQLANLGITTVRVVEIVESAEDYTLEITFEDNLSGIATAPTYSVQSAYRATSETNAQPGSANAPIMFEAPTPLVTSATGNEVWIFASGDNKWWGGCSVWVSSDGESYSYFGNIPQPARQGVITNRLPVHGTPDEDDILSVDLSMSRATLTGATRQDADNFVTLCWIAGDDNGEFISYQNAELTRQYQYNLSYLRRGVYGSNIMSHSADSQFVRCDSNLALKIPFNADAVGQTYYVKLCSFNVFGTVEQALAEATPYSFTVHGYNRSTATESGTATMELGETITINYDRTYQTPPYPQAIVIDGERGDVLTITNMTTTSFDVCVNNSNIVFDFEIPERTINYIVYGVV
jgi:hypothetical protein